jgi:hypothetical protein
MHAFDAFACPLAACTADWAHRLRTGDWALPQIPACQLTCPFAALRCFSAPPQRLACCCPLEQPLGLLPTALDSPLSPSLFPLSFHVLLICPCCLSARFPQSKRLPDAYRAAFAQLVLAMDKGDEGAIARSLSSLGVVTEREEAPLQARLAYSMFDTRGRCGTVLVRTSMWGGGGGGARRRGGAAGEWGGRPAARRAGELGGKLQRSCSPERSSSSRTGRVR